jgi:hypothetical protein
MSRPEIFKKFLTVFENSKNVENIGNFLNLFIALGKFFNEI